MKLLKKFINLTAVPLSLGLLINAVCKFSSNLTPNPFPTREGEQESKPLSFQGRGLERGFQNQSHIALIIPSLPKGIAESPRRWQISQKFISPNRQAPQTTSGGRNREETCKLASKETVQPLIPQNNFGLTVAERPSFYWFVPQISVKTAHFSVVDDRGVVYETTVKLPQKPGIIGLTLPSSASGLKVGKKYHWYFAIACHPEAETEMTVDGWVERIAATPALSKQLARTKPQQLSQVYAQNGIWHEALHTLVKQRLTNSSDRTVTTNWQTFLESVGLKNLVSQPLLNQYIENAQILQDSRRCECGKQ